MRTYAYHFVFLINGWHANFIIYPPHAQHIFVYFRMCIYCSTAITGTSHERRGAPSQRGLPVLSAFVLITKYSCYQACVRRMHRLQLGSLLVESTHNGLVIMMTSSNGNIFRVTGHLCGEFIGPRWIYHTKASDADLWSLLWSAPE